VKASILAGAPFEGVGAQPVEGLMGVSKLSELFSLGFRNIFSKSPLLKLIVEFMPMLPAVSSRSSPPLGCAPSDGAREPSPQPTLGGRSLPLLSAK
jgi:hypothetical protein